MSRTPEVAFMNGELVPFAQARVPIEDRGLQFGESLYEVVAITCGEPRMLREHALRMLAAARFLGIQRGAPSLEEWQRIVLALQQREQLAEGLVIAQLTGGTAPRAHLPTGELRPTFFVYLREHHFPRAAEVEAGVSVVTRPDPRWARCDLKTNMLLPAVLAKREAMASGASEVLFVGADGWIREGAASNVFLVERETIWAPAPSSHALSGLTGPLVSSLARGLGLESEVGSISEARLLHAREVFLTSTTLLLMPVVSVDGRSIGDGRAGPVARQLAAALRFEWQLD